MEKIIKLLTSFFYIGYLPLIPGTYASIAGLLIYLLVRSNIYFFWGATLLITAIGFLTAGRAEVIFREKDPSKIVIDEVSGMLLTFCFIPFSFFNLIAGFIFFRFFDIVKPYPAKQIQKLNGSAGIMFDDIFAEFYANSCLRIIILFIGRKINM